MSVETLMRTDPPATAGGTDLDIRQAPNARDMKARGKREAKLSASPLVSADSDQGLKAEITSCRRLRQSCLLISV
jgi:hypothetical protein